METKNTILARQKEMQLSLDKVKHLIRLIQTFNFNQALAETEAKDVRVQDSAEGVAGCEAAPEANSIEKEVPESSSVSSSADGDDRQEEPQVRSATTGGDAGGQPVVDSCPAAGAGDQALPGGEGHAATGLQAEGTAKPETEAAPEADVPTSLTVATTNGTTEPGCPVHSPAGGCTTKSESKMAAVNPPETTTEKKQEEMSDSDGSSTNNSKTSEPPQHSLPALVVSLDNKK